MSRLGSSEALSAAFAAESVAIVGASADPRKLGHLVLKTLMDSGYQGEIYPINRSTDAILGVRTWGRLAEIAGPVDVAVLIVPSDQLIDALRDCAHKPVKLVAAITSGFAEAGDHGKALQKQLEDELRAAPYRLIGPNCEGYVVPASKTFVTFSLMTLGLQTGPVGIVAQSGAVSGTIAHRLNKMGVGIRALISTGNEADLTASDGLEWFADDPSTNTIVCYLEQIRDPGRFLDVARKLKGKKAIVIEKPGRGQASSAAVTTHTGAIAGDDRVADGIFEEFSIVRAHDLTAAIDSAAALSFNKRLKGKRIGIVSIAGGLAVEASDLFEASGFEVPRFCDDLQNKIRKFVPYFAAVRNPVDLTGAALSSPDLFKTIVDLVIADEDLDAVVVIVTFAKLRAFADVLMQVAQASDKPCLVVWTAPEALSPEPLRAFREQAFPVFDSPLRALTGMKAISRFSGLS